MRSFHAAAVVTALTALLCVTTTASAAAPRTLAQAKRQIAALTKANATLKRANTGLRGQVTSLTAARAAALARVAEVEQLLASVTAARDTALASLASTRLDLTTRTTERDAANSTLATRTAERDAALANLATRTTERDDALATLTTRTSERDALQTDVDLALLDLGGTGTLDERIDHLRSRMGDHSAYSAHERLDEINALVGGLSLTTEGRLGAVLSTLGAGSNLHDGVTTLATLSGGTGTLHARQNAMRTTLGSEDGEPTATTIDAIATVVGGTSPLDTSLATLATLTGGTGTLHERQNAIRTTLGSEDGESAATTVNAITAVVGGASPLDTSLATLATLIGGTGTLHARQNAMRSTLGSEDGEPTATTIDAITAVVGGTSPLDTSLATLATLTGGTGTLHERHDVIRTTLGSDVAETTTTTINDIAALVKPAGYGDIDVPGFLVNSFNDANGVRTQLYEFLRLFEQDAPGIYASVVDDPGFGGYDSLATLADALQPTG